MRSFHIDFSTGVSRRAVARDWDAAVKEIVQAAQATDSMAVLLDNHLSRLGVTRRVNEVVTFQSDRFSSTRNHIALGISGPEYDVETDTVYEICDAEFNSDKAVHQLWAEYGSPSGSAFAQRLRWNVIKVAQRENMLRATSKFQSLAIARRIAEDWSYARA